MHNIILILDNIRSLQNIGSIFRTAAGFGITKIYLCGISGQPPRKEIHKTALGAETKVPWNYYSHTADAISDLKKSGFEIAALEITNQAIPISEFKFEKPLALVVGNEVDGVGEDILKLCDHQLMIPITNKIRSLNVSIATAIAVYELRRSWNA